jgi:hypothetical protein
MLPNALRWRSASPLRETLGSLIEHRSGSGHGRLIQYWRSLDMTMEHPWLGVGPGQWSIQYPGFAIAGDPSVHQGRAEPTDRYPNSDLVTVLSEYGLLVATVAIALCLAQLWRAWVLTRCAESEEARARAWVGPIALCAILWLGLVDAVLVEPATGFVAAVVAASLVPAERRAGFGSSPATLRRRLAALAIALGAVIAAVQLGRTLIARSLLHDPRTVEQTAPWAIWLAPDDYPVRMAISSLSLMRHRCDRARPHLSAATDLHPHAQVPRRLLAACRSLRAGVARDAAPLPPD